MGQPLSYFEITSNKVEDMQAFYKDLFGWKIQVMPDMGGYGLVDTDSGKESVSGGIGPVMGKAGVKVYFYAPDLRAALDRAVKLGGKEVAGPMPIPGFGNFAVFSDPDGNEIGLWDQKSA